MNDPLVIGNSPGVYLFASTLSLPIILAAVTSKYQQNGGKDWSQHMCNLNSLNQIHTSMKFLIKPTSVSNVSFYNFPCTETFSLILKCHPSLLLALHSRQHMHDITFLKFKAILILRRIWS